MITNLRIKALKLLKLNERTNEEILSSVTEVRTDDIQLSDEEAMQVSTTESVNCFKKCL